MKATIFNLVVLIFYTIANYWIDEQDGLIIERFTGAVVSLVGALLRIEPAVPASCDTSPRHKQITPQ